MKIARCIDSDAEFTTTLTGIFGIILAIGLWRHELWRDEFHGWMLALHSNSVAQLLGNLRGEGHLPLSYLMMYILSHCTANPLALQAAEWVIATVNVFLLLRFAPFERWQKVLFIFGYFPLFEYGVISRSYSLDVLGLFGFCAVFSWAKQHQRKPWLAWIFLLVMAFNEPFGALLALPLVGLLIADFLPEKKTTFSQWLWIGSILAASAALFGFILLRTVSLRQLTSQFLHHTPHHFADGLKTALQILVRAIIPRIHLPNTIWNLSQLQAQLQATHGLEWLLGALLFCCFCRLLIASVRLPFNLWNHPPAFTVWATGSGLLFLFFWITGNSLTGPRHTGHFYLFFIACWWLAASFPERSESAVPRWFQYVQKNARRDFYFLLAFQLILGLFAYSLDFFYLFSANQATASYIRRHHLEQAALVALDAPTGEAIAATLGRSVYFPQFDAVREFLPMSLQLSPGYLSHATNAQLAQRTAGFISLHNANQDVLVVTNDPTTVNAALQKYFLWRSPPVIVEDEQYDLYFVPRGKWMTSETKK